jgi:hypothetical protein
VTNGGGAKAHTGARKSAPSFETYPSRAVNRKGELRVRFLRTLTHLNKTFTIGCEVGLRLLFGRRGYLPQLISARMLLTD